MFDAFPNQWTPVAFSRALRKKPLSKKIGGTPVALFRDEKGQAHALVDQCPHRGVKLSLGEVKDGCLECPFHAWKFNGAGDCVEIPLNAIADDKKARYRATSIPLVESGGVIWIFTGETAVGSPPVPEAALMKGRRFEVTQVWKCHWTRAMENMLDSPHVPYLHRNTIGRFVRPQLKPGSVMDVRVEPTSQGFRTVGVIDDRPVGQNWLDWLRPNGMTLNIPIPNALWRIHAFCIPIDENTTEMMVFSVRTFLPWMPAFIMDRVNKRILDEDRAVLESSQPSIVPPASDELSVASDRATLTFRRWYFRTMAGPNAPRAGGDSDLVTLSVPMS
jgi:phenylpropionate dioxygenase-like ring-hydroxylating dioxygenase large terminal subunit